MAQIIYLIRMQMTVTFMMCKSEWREIPSLCSDDGRTSRPLTHIQSRE